MNKKQILTDRLLILQYRKGNTSVLPTLVERYHKTFCEKAYWVVKDREAAKDIAQESWITIIGKLHSLNNVDSFKSWASKIVYNKAIDRVNIINKENNINVAKYVEYNNEYDEDERKLILESLLIAIQKLPSGKQDIIRLFYKEEYSIIEISKFLNVPVGTVKSRLFKAREKLKEILKK